MPAETRIRPKMKITVDTRTIYMLPESEWARLVQGREIQLETYLIPPTEGMDDGVRKYLNSIIVYQLLRGKVEGTTPVDILKLPNVITREDAHSLLEMLGLSALSQVKEVKVSVKQLLVDGCFGSDVAMNTLREKNGRAYVRTLPSFEDYFGVKTLKALKESELTMEEIVECIRQRADKDDIDWGVLFEVLADQRPETEGWMYRIINDRLRRGGERNTIRSVADLRRKRRLSSSDSESDSEPAGKFVKFSDLPEHLEEGEEHPFPVPQLQDGSKAAAVMQTISQITGISPERSPKMACISRALQRREARYGASKHQLWTSLSKNMLCYVSSKLIPEEHVHMSLGVDDSAESPVSVILQ